MAGIPDDAEWRRSGEQTPEAHPSCVGVFPDDIALEIGAGTGGVGAAIAPMCKEWIDADVPARMLEYLRLSLAHLGNVRTVLLNGHDLTGIASQSVDLVYCTVSFMHLDKRQRYSYIREAMRVLRPRGRMFVDNVNLLSDDGWNFFVNTTNAYLPSERPLHMGKTSNPQELETFFRRADFENIRQPQDGLRIGTYGIKP